MNPNLVSEDFNQMCTEFRVEASIQSLPNPGDLFKAMRVITFKNFSDLTVKVNQGDTQHLIPGKGSVQVMLKPGEMLPTLEKVEQ